MRKTQATADIIVPIPLIKKDGTQAIGLTLTTLSTKIIKPDGTALTGYTEATFTEPNGDGVYVCKFPSNATTKAFTQADQANPYTLTLDSSTADVEPTERPVWIVSKYPWELATPGDILVDPATDKIDGSLIDASIAARPTNPLLTNDARLNNLDATIGSRSTHSAADVKTAIEADGSKLDAVYDKLPTGNIADQATLTNGTYGLAELRAMILTRLASKAYVTGIGPTSAVVTNGTIISGDVSSIQTRNQQYLVVQETGLFIADFEWIGLSVKETKIRFIGHLTFGTGVTNHKVELKIWNYTTSAWDDVLGSVRDIPSSEVDYVKDFTVPGDINNYYAGAAPNMSIKLRIEHQQNTTPDLQHHLWIDSFVIGPQEVEYSAPDTPGVNAIREAVYDPVSGLVVIASLLDAIATSSELQAMFDQIKGVGWTNETLKAIKAASGGSVNIMSATKGAIQVSYAKIGGTVEVVKGDTINIPYGPLGKDITGRKIYFAAKQLLSDATYKIPVKEITTQITNAATFTGTIPLTSAELNLTAGNYYAEIESRASDGSTPVTELKFTLKVVDQVITPAA